MLRFMLLEQTTANFSLDFAISLKCRNACTKEIMTKFSQVIFRLWWNLKICSTVACHSA